MDMLCRYNPSRALRHSSFTIHLQKRSCKYAATMDDQRSWRPFYVGLCFILSQTVLYLTFTLLLLLLLLLFISLLNFHFILAHMNFVLLFFSHFFIFSVKPFACKCAQGSVQSFSFYPAVNVPILTSGTRESTQLLSEFLCGLLRNCCLWQILIRTLMSHWF